mmetsp:Transcript_23338/g.36206  ORF Transcript_23338/g.36206 Transcript_23338/m.36206 type:complete len:98 (-) Transcript_23338:137-430(-)
MDGAFKFSKTLSILSHTKQSSSINFLPSSSNTTSFRPNLFYGIAHIIFILYIFHPMKDKINRHGQPTKKKPHAANLVTHISNVGPASVSAYNICHRS